MDSGLCREQVNCHMSVAGSFAIVAAMLWFLAGTSSFFVQISEDRESLYRSHATRTSVPSSSLAIRSGAENRANQTNNNTDRTLAETQKEKHEDVTSVTDPEEEYREETDERMESISLE